MNRPFTDYKDFERDLPELTHLFGDVLDSIADEIFKDDKGKYGFSMSEDMLHQCIVDCILDPNFASYDYVKSSAVFYRNLMKNGFFKSKLAKEDEVNLVRSISLRIISDFICIAYGVGFLVRGELLSLSRELDECHDIVSVAEAFEQHCLKALR